MMDNTQRVPEEQIRRLVRDSLEARRNSYAPYSGFWVGAALLTADGRIFTGCNIENAAFTPTVCAERTAFFKAVSEGAREFWGIAVAGSPQGDEVTQYAYPCGVCRQVMMEFCRPSDFKVIVARSEEDYKVMPLKDLLPEGFGPDNLN